MNQSDTQGSTTTRIIISILLSLTILAAGVGGFYLLKYLREDPEVQIPNIPAPLVAVHTVRTIDKTITVKGFGTVRANGLPNSLRMRRRLSRLLILSRRCLISLRHNIVG